MTIETDDKMLTVGQAADFLGVTRTTLRQWARDGKIGCARTPGSSKAPGHRRFLLSDLRRMRLVSGSGPTCMAIYINYKIHIPSSALSDKNRLIALTSLAGLHPAFSVEEHEGQMNKPLAERDGFRKIVDLVRNGDVDGIVTDEDMLTGWGNEPWLRVCGILGLSCWIPSPDGESLVTYPE